MMSPPDNVLGFRYPNDDGKIYLVDQRVMSDGGLIRLQDGTILDVTVRIPGMPGDVDEIGKVTLVQPESVASDTKIWDAALFNC